MKDLWNNSYLGVPSSLIYVRMFDFFRFICADIHTNATLDKDKKFMYRGIKSVLVAATLSCVRRTHTTHTETNLIIFFIKKSICSREHSIGLSVWPLAIVSGSANLSICVRFLIPNAKYVPTYYTLDVL